MKDNKNIFLYTGIIALITDITAGSVLYYWSSSIREDMNRLLTLGDAGYSEAAARMFDTVRLLDLLRFIVTTGGHIIFVITLAVYLKKRFYRN